MRFTAAEVAAATDGTLIGPDIDVDGASIDSRSMPAGALFVPIVAARNGHDFIGGALAAGAAAYLTAQNPVGATAIRVDDTSAALTLLGGAARSRLAPPVVGITGSVGKTTTKDMLASILRRSRIVAASERSFNNELGVPLTLINAPPGTQASVLEMGARGMGHIAELCAVARPTVAVVTLIALAHAELFGDIDSIRRAKGELIEGLPRDGWAVLNADDPAVWSMRELTDAAIVGFGRSSDVAVRLLEVGADLRARIAVESTWGKTEVALGARGEHQVVNAGAAAAAALVMGASIDDVAAGLSDKPLASWRMDLSESSSGALILNDAYNANRTSMEAALRSLAALDRSKKVAVLGYMAELGVAEPDEHRAIANLAEELEIDVIAFGTDLYGVTPSATIDEALEALGHLSGDHAVLVKGSRMNGLERLAERLLG